MKSKLIWTFASLFTLGLILWHYANNGSDIGALKAANEDAANLLNLVREKRDRAREEHASVEVEIDQSRASLQAFAPRADSAYEDELMQWIGKVQQLSDFLTGHPEWRISQMDSLTENDWLDVTKDTDLKTEADYRKALARLRELARKTTMREVSKAIKKASVANEGEPFSSLADLLPFLPDGFDVTTLEYNHSVEITQLPGRPSLAFPYIDKIVDPLWEVVHVYKEKGGVINKFVGYNDSHKVELAMTSFTKSHGQSPTSFDQLRDSPEVQDMDPLLLEAFFTALTTTPPD